MATRPVDLFSSILPGQEPVDESSLIDPADYSAVRSRFFNGVMSAVQALPPVSNDLHTLRFVDAKWDGDPKYGPSDIVEGLGKGRTLHRTIKGRVELVDNTTGQVVSKSGRKTLATVPYFTDDGSFLIDGTEMSVSRQPRPLPGVYTQYRDDGSLSSKFRVTSGGGFDIVMVPDTGEFRLKFQNRHVALYPVLKKMGVSDESLKEAWGDLYDVNRKTRLNAGTEQWIRDQADKGLKYLEKFPDLVDSSDQEDSYALGVRAWFARKGLSSVTTARTLGRAYDKVTPETLITSASKLAKVYKGEIPPDNQDSLEFQEIWSPEDRVADALKKDVGGRMRQMLWKASGAGDVSKITTAPLNPYIYDLFVNSGSEQVLEQANPLDMYNQATRLSWMGDGGITDAQGAPMSTRSIQPSYAGFIDLSRTPESYRIGLDMYLASGVKLGPDKKLYRQMLDASTKKPVWVDMQTASREMVGFPSFYHNAGKSKYVYAIDSEGLTIVPRQEVKYVLPKSDDMSSDIGNLVPLKSGVKGMRQLMGSKFATHALSLVDPDVPFVRTKTASDGDVLERLGKFAGARFSPVDGIVETVDENSITIKDSEGHIEKIPLYNMRPYARKTYITNTPVVKQGDVVKKDQILASSDYTDKTGKLAIMKNLRVAYMPFGTTFEDGIPISESAAKKLTTRLMLSPRFETDDQTLLDGKTFKQQFPRKYTPEQYAKIGNDGVVKVGETLMYGDPVYLGLVKREASESTLGKALMTDSSEVWTHHSPGRVVRSAISDDGVVSTNIVTEDSLKEGDKVSIAFGGKGTAVVYPDDEMPKDAKGNPLEVILNPHGVSSRTNPAQLLAAALGKIAQATGQPYILEGYDEDNLSEYVKEELKKNGFTDKEELIDQRTGRKIPDVTTGVLSFYRMQQLSEDKGKGRGIGQGYTQEGTPLKGGEHGAKHYGFPEYRAFLTHGAHKVLADLKLINSQRNDDFWSKLKTGGTPSIPDTPDSYKRMRAMIRASGVDLSERENGEHIYAMTNENVKKLTGDRKLKNPSTYDVSMRPLRGGLFDPDITSGKFAYIELPEPMLNPIMEDAFRSIFETTQDQLLDIISGKSDKTLKDRLLSLDIDSELKKTRRDIKNWRGDRRDKAFKKHAYLQAMKDHGVSPVDFLLDRVPVLPQEFRPISKMKNTLLVPDPNRMYRDLMFRLEDFDEVKRNVPELEAEARESVYKALAATIGTRKTDSPKLEQANVGGVLQQFLGKGSPKFSQVQRRVIGSDIDLYGLAVIVPDYKLRLDEAGVPEDQAWEIFSPFITRNLVKKGLPPTKAVEEVQKKTPRARESLLEEMEDRPVILNRAPTLHRFGVAAFRPKLVKGSAIHINPWVCGPFNADFDGDTMSMTVPVTRPAVDEAYAKMLPSKLLLDDKSGAPNYLPGHEFLHGLHILSRPSTLGEKPFKVKKDADMLKTLREAFSKGEIDINTPVLEM